MSLISDFQRELLTSIVGSESARTNLVRKHDKNLSVLGEFSFPSLTNSRVWDRVGNLSSVQSSSFKSLRIDRIEEQKDICVVFLNREYALKKLFGVCRDSDFWSNNGLNDAELGIDPVTLDLTSARAVLVSQILGWSFIYFYLFILFIRTQL